MKKWQYNTVRVDCLPHRKWREIQQQPGTARPGNMLGCCLISFHFLWAIHSIRPVLLNAGLPVSIYRKIRDLFLVQSKYSMAHAATFREGLIWKGEWRGGDK